MTADVTGGPGGNTTTFPGVSIIFDSSVGLTTYGATSGNLAAPNGVRPVPANLTGANAMLGPNGGISAPYQGKANFAFIDGHAKTLDPRSTNPDGLNHPENNQWDALR